VKRDERTTTIKKEKRNRKNGAIQLGGEMMGEGKKDAKQNMSFERKLIGEVTLWSVQTSGPKLFLCPGKVQTHK
jgi:hypothetical protein